MLANVRLLLAALWAGSVWGVSYLAAPSAFAVLDGTLPGVESLPCLGRGRDIGCPTPPAQIPTGGITA